VAIATGISLPSLDETANGGAEFLDNLAITINAIRFIFIVKLPPRDAVCLPESGFFTLPLARDVDSWVTPLAPTLLSINLPRSLSSDSPQSYFLLRELIMTAGAMPTLSVGPNVGTRVVVAPSWLKTEAPVGRIVDSRRRAILLHKWIRETDGCRGLNEFGSLV